MTREQALQKARAKWGKWARIEIGPRLSSPEERQANHERRKQLAAQRDQLDTELTAWFESQPFYQENRAKRRAVLEEMKHVPSSYYKFRVGYVSGIAGLAMFHVKGNGDTWEEAFKQATPEGQKQATAERVAQARK